MGNRQRPIRLADIVGTTATASQYAMAHELN